MKRSAKYLSGIVLGLILVLSAVPGHADDTKKIKVTIPFDFLVGNKYLKAGDYIELIPGAREKESAANRAVGDQMGAGQ